MGGGGRGGGGGNEQLGAPALTVLPLFPGHMVGWLGEVGRAPQKGLPCPWGHLRALVAQQAPPADVQSTWYVCAPSFRNASTLAPQVPSWDFAYGWKVQPAALHRAPWAMAQSYEVRAG